MPATERLVTDSSEHVRESLAAVVNDLATVLGKEDTIELLLPMLLSLLRDSVPEVRLNVMSNLDSLNRVIGVELLSQSLLPAIVDLAEDSKWRIRLAIIGHIPKLAEHLGGALFSERLNALCLTWLGDDVFAVRKAAAENLRMLSEHFGEPWTLQQLVPKLERMHVHTNYMQRMTCLYGAQVLTQSLTRDAIYRTILPFVLKLANDPVPNVRFTVAKTLPLIARSPVGPDYSRTAQRTITAERGILAALDRLNSDADRDVRFFAEKVSV